MANRTPAPSVFSVLLVVVVGAVAAVTDWVRANMPIVIAIVGAIVLIVAWRINHRRKKQAAWVMHLQEKYKNPDIVDGILNSRYWIGQTEEQLIDSRGQPEEVDRKVLKTKRREIWKYNQLRKGQYAIKITVENGAVAGWEDKH